MKPIFTALVLATALAAPLPVIAAKFTYACSLSDGQFTPGIVVSYDDKSGSVELVEAYGDVLRADQKLGPIRNGEGFFEFSLDSTFDGYVEMSDVVTLDTDANSVFIARYFLNKDGSSAGQGPVVEGRCSTQIAEETGAPATNIRTADPAPMTVTDAKIAIGFSPEMAKTTLYTGAEFKFGIVDAGFDGLEEWINDNPEFRGKIKFESLRKNNRKSSESHGFKVFKVAHSIMPTATFYLYETPAPVEQFKKILDALKKDNVFFASMSLGIKQYMAGFDPSLTYKQLKLLDEYQINFLVSSGNQRGDTHSFSYSDLDEDGKLEFSRALKSNGKLLEYNKVILGKDREISLTLSWGEYPKRVSNFEIQLVDKDNTVLASASATGDLPVVKLRYKAIQRQTLWLKLIDKNEQPPAPDLKFGMFVRGTSNNRATLNGQESLGIMAQYESPFLTVVGGFGMDSSEQLQPSNFSSIGHTNTGQIAPHILGPGQFLIDGKPLNGTSFATPFIAALYSVFADYNIKNVIEATASKERLRAGLTPEEAGRWGVPEVNKIFSNPCSNSNKVENLRSSIDGANVVVEFEFTRFCMEGLDYYLHAFVSGDVPLSTRVFTKGPVLASGAAKQQVRGWVKKISLSAKIVAEPIRIEIPLKFIPRSQYGREVELSFKISTRAQWDPVAIAADIPVLKIKLPEPAPLIGEAPGSDLAQMAKRAVEIHRFPEGIQLAGLALASDDLGEAEVLQAREARSMAAIALRDIAALTEFAIDDRAAQSDTVRPAVRLGGILLSQKKFTEARDIFKTCLGAAGDDLYRCQIGYVVASKLSGESTRAEIAATYGDGGTSLADSPSLHAKALAVFLGKLSGGAYRDYTQEQARANMGKPAAALTVGAGFYYLGLMGVWSDNTKFARDSFHQSAASGTVMLEAALSVEWLANLPK